MDVTVTNPGSVPITSTVAAYSTFFSDHTYSGSFDNGFSGFGVGIGISPLPVELLSFKGKYIEGRGNVLDWSTATEENTSHFIIEHSFNAVDFRPLGNKVPAAGQSTEVLDYQYWDENPKATINYYRLKMVDLDDTYEYSQVISIDNSKPNSITLSPNPTKGGISIFFGNDITEEVRVEVFDMAGKKVIGNIFNLEDSRQIPLNMDALSKGTYMVRVIQGDNTYSEKVVKL